MYARNIILAINAFAVAITLIATVQPPTSARAGGHGAHRAGVAASRLMYWQGHRNRFGYALPYGYHGGVVAVGREPYDDFKPYVLSQELVLANEPPRVLDCKRSRQNVTVPSEDGGTRQISVTRC